MMRFYDEALLKKDPAMNHGREYRQCAISVMDTISDPDITFDSDGVCNYYHEYRKVESEQVFKGAEGRRKLEEAVEAIRKSGSGKSYDCILGLSGGADSSYLALLAKRHGLRPLVVHFDYGWNLELAVNNIQNIVTRLGYDLHTIVMDWEEMKSLQRSYYRSSVLDLDVPADHMIFGSLYRTAAKYGIKHILSGKNVVTEAVLPRSWNYDKFDLVNLRNIHRRFENTPLRKLPTLGIWQFGRFHALHRLEIVELLNFVEYDKQQVKEAIKSELGWKDYGGKHYENVFTRFYQGYVLPVKFGIDKRKAHLSNLIFSGQMTKEQALQELAQPPCDEAVVREDLEYVSKKLGFSEQELLSLINQPNRSHLEFGTDAFQKKVYYGVFKLASPVTKTLKALKILR
jgi:N-acetyl sugar amidotransferase